MSRALRNLTTVTAAALLLAACSSPASPEPAASVTDTVAPSSSSRQPSVPDASDLTALLPSATQFPAGQKPSVSVFNPDRGDDASNVPASCRLAPSTGQTAMISSSQVSISMAHSSARLQVVKDWLAGCPGYNLPAAAGATPGHTTLTTVPAPPVNADSSLAYTLSTSGTGTAANTTLILMAEVGDVWITASTDRSDPAKTAQSTALANDLFTAAVLNVRHR